MRAAASRFAGPSGPASVGLRMAPVSTNGSTCGQSRSTRKAVSSRVSVPWVTTTPQAPAFTACDAESTRSRICAKVRFALGTASMSWMSRGIPSRASPGTAAARSAAFNRMTTPSTPWVWPAIEIVPPSVNSATPIPCASRSHAGNDRSLPSVAHREWITSADPLPRRLLDCLRRQGGQGPDTSYHRRTPKRRGAGPPIL